MKCSTSYVSRELWSIAKRYNCLTYSHNSKLWQRWILRRIRSSKKSYPGGCRDSSVIKSTFCSSGGCKFNPCIHISGSQTPITPASGVQHPLLASEITGKHISTHSDTYKNKQFFLKERELIYCWWECQIKELFWLTTWQFLNYLNHSYQMTQQLCSFAFTQINWKLMSTQRAARECLSQSYS